MTRFSAAKQVTLIACLLLCAAIPLHAQQQGQQEQNQRLSTVLSLEKFSLRIATARQTFAYAREHPDDRALTELGNSLLKIIREDEAGQETQVTALARTMLSTGNPEQFDQQIRQRLSGLVPPSIAQAVQSLGGPAAILQNSSKIIADSVEDLGRLAPQRRGDAGGSLFRLVESARAQGAPKCAIYLLAATLCTALEQPGCVVSMAAAYLNCINGG
jgi:hypothetical protein